MAATKKCSECMAEIPKKAKRCQYCTSKQKYGVGIVRGTLVVLAVIIFILVVTSIFSGSGKSISPISVSTVEQDKKLDEIRKKNYEARNKVVTDEFSNNRKTIIDSINRLLKEGKATDANIEANRFINAGVKDDELTKISSKIKSYFVKQRAANETGIWSNSFYVDEFGEPTKKPYIGSNTIHGVFSNTATQNSKLNANFLISGQADISIQLYEYARKNPVKSYGDRANRNYSILVKDKDGKKLKLSAKNWSERLNFVKSDSKILHKSLMKGGVISFRIVNSDSYTDKYSFEIDATYYKNAYRKLKEAYKKKG